MLSYVKLFLKVFEALGAGLKLIKAAILAAKIKTRQKAVAVITSRKTSKEDKHRALNDLEK